MRATVAVRGAEARNRPVRESAGDGALGVDAGGRDDGDQFRLGMAGQVVDVPVSSIVVPGRHATVTVDAGEAAAPEGASGVGVGTGVEGVSAERADFEFGRFGQSQQEGVRPARGSRVVHVAALDARSKTVS